MLDLAFKNFASYEFHVVSQTSFPSKPLPEGTARTHGNLKVY